MQNNLGTYLLAFCAFVGGFALMTVEIIYPRISAIWFGNVLSIWAIDLASSLLILGLGYRLGSYLLARRTVSVKKLLLGVYALAAFFFFVAPFWYPTLLDSIIEIPVVAGALLFSVLFMVPTLGLLAVSSPVLVDILSKGNGKGSNTIFGISSLGGAIGVLVVGLWTLPYLGIQFNCYLLGILLIVNLAGLGLFFKKVPG